MQTAGENDKKRTESKYVHERNRKCEQNNNRLKINFYPLSSVHCMMLHNMIIILLKRDDSLIHSFTRSLSLFICTEIRFRFPMECVFVSEEANNIEYFCVVRLMCFDSR